jgi:hypothetical protein
MSSPAALAGSAHGPDGHPVDDARPSSGDICERLALHRSLLLRRRARGRYVLVTAQRIVVNSAAQGLLTPDDEPALHQAADRLRARPRGDVLTLLLSGGAVAVRAEPVPDHESLVGTILQLRPLTRSAVTSQPGHAAENQPERV